METIAISIGVAVLLVSYGRSADFSRYTPFSIGPFKRVDRSSGSGQCVDCGREVEHGEKRHWYKEVVILGIPTISYDSGTHIYCEHHASFEWQEADDDDELRDWKYSAVARAITSAAAAFPETETFTEDESPFDDAVASTTAAFQLIPLAIIVLVAALAISVTEAAMSR